MIPIWLQQLDEQGLLWIQQFLRVEVLNPVVKGFTTLGNVGLIWIVLSLLLLWKPSTRKAGITSLCAMILGLLVTNLCLKHLFMRPRPYEVMELLVPLVTSSDPNSFPSGHTCAAFAAGIAWAKTLPKRWMCIVAVVQAVLMGFSRLYVGVHYPSDVIAGALIGSVCGIIAYYLVQHWENRQKNSRQ